MERRSKRPGADYCGSSATPSSLTRSISPPARSKRPRFTEPVDDAETSSEAEKEAEQPGDVDDDETSSEAEEDPSHISALPERSCQIFPSPFQLTKIRDLPPEANIDTVTLKDILSDPLISECWEFNYLHDVDFLMSAFDDDVRHLVKVHVVHGFWKSEDPNRLALVEAASRHSNVALHSAFMPEMFGTHHSKMMILLRHDDTAQIIIHTANMIVRDWTNMTQAVWRSPLLPLLTSQAAADGNIDPKTLQPGSGERFKVDFLNYLYSYDTRRPTCASIAEDLRKYDFSAIRGTLIASVPGRHNIHDRTTATRWGWAAMQQALKSVPIHSGPGKSEIAVQISSIATLGPTNTWLKDTFFHALSGGVRAAHHPPLTTSMTLGNQPPQPEFKVVFPTPNEIRRSLDGYAAGGSIHTKIQSAQQKKQLHYLKPIFHHWANDRASNDYDEQDRSTDALRNRAAPHIKTYIRYGNKSRDTIDWALLTSANLSKQAWGEAVKTNHKSGSGGGEVRIASYEIGVLVWPGLFGQGAVMRGVFGRDTPGGEEEEAGKGDDGKEGVVVGLRMPYSLPLKKYGEDEIPWVATASYDEPDWMGGVWKD